VKIGCGLLAGMLAPASSMRARAVAVFFDVATSSMFPEGAGGTAFLQFDYQDQNHNWSGTSQAPDANNDDKEIKTYFTTLGFQYMFNSSWGVEAELPYDFRTFKTDVGGGDIVTKNWNQLGDIRVQGIYTGFFADQSAGVTFGLNCRREVILLTLTLLTATRKSARAARTFCSAVFIA